MSEIWVIYEKEINADGVMQERLIGSYESEQEARDVYNEILLEKPDEVNSEIIIKKINKNFLQNFTQDTEYKVFLLEKQMDTLAHLINQQATIISNHENRLKKLEKINN